MLRHESKDMDLAEDPEIYRCWDMNLAEDPEIHMDADLRIRRHGSSRGSWDTCGCWDMNPEVWISQRILRYIWMLFRDPETWILQRSLRYIWMLIYGSGDMDLAEVPEIHVDVETWIRRHGSCRGPWGIKMLRHESETWILQWILRYIWMLIYGSGDMDLAEELEIHMHAYIRIWRHGSCRGSWHTCGCWDMNPKTWILQRTLRYKDAETWIGDMDLAEDPEIYMDAYMPIRRHGSCRGSWMFLIYTWVLRPESETWIRRDGCCRGSWDIEMLRHESGDVDVDLAEHPWDTNMLRHESEDVDLVEDPEIHMAAELWIRQHGSCRGSWDTHGCWDMNPETWILQRSLRHKDVETWIRRCGSCSRSSLVDATTWIGDMIPAEDLEIRSVQKT